MKHIVHLFLITILLASAACSDHEPTGYETQEVKVQVGGELTVREGIEVTLTDSRGSIYRQRTDAQGVATFGVPVGLYRAAVSWISARHDGWRSIYNGSVSNVVVRSGEAVTVDLPLSQASTSAIVIAELYVGGCQKDDGSGWFHRDKYVIVANNSGDRVTLPGLCLGIVSPFNSYGLNKNYDADGHLNYEHEGFVPAASAIWYFQGDEVTFEPWEQRVIALNGAINHTLTYSASVDLSKAEYYCTYDIERYKSTNYYPSPSQEISTSHYLRVVRYGDEVETAWPVSTSSPALFIFTPPAGMTAVEFGTDAGNVWYDEGRALPAFTCRKVPASCVLDGVEVFSSAWEENYKRLPSGIDVGHVVFTPRLGHSLVRRVDEAATQEHGHTVYQDTNNSSNDFVERDHASLRDR